MIFQGACLGKTNQLVKVAPCVIMVKAKDLVKKGHNTMPKEIWCDSSNTNLDKSMYCGYWCFVKVNYIGPKFKKVTVHFVIPNVH